jgi:apolipoprotein D and lipocalin family protein
MSLAIEASPLATVAHVNLNQYMGTWYEIAKLPNRFEKKCQFLTTAQYQMLDNGDVSVVNECHSINKEKIHKISSKGIAWVVNKDVTSKLKVSFVPFLQSLHLFGGDYWILDLADDYSYSIVGTEDRQYLWILYRSPQIPANLYSQLIDKIAAMGFDVNKIETMPATAPKD